MNYKWDDELQAYRPAGENALVGAFWASLGTALLFVAVFVAAFVFFSPEASAEPLTFDQRDFPCQEDEVLGYAPQFGHDKVGCIHLESFYVDRDGNLYLNPTNEEVTEN